MRVKARGPRSAAIATAGGRLGLIRSVYRFPPPAPTPGPTADEPGLPPLAQGPGLAPRQGPSSEPGPGPPTLADRTPRSPHPMTTLQNDVLATPGASGTLVSRARVRLGATFAVHAVVDFFSFVVVALLPVLRGRLDLTDGQIALAIATGSIASGVVQPLVAWASDRLHTRIIGTISFAVAVVAIALVPRAGSFAGLLALHAIGAAGIGAFHPVAAAAVGHLSGSKRSLGVALFYLAGMIGGTLGSYLSPAFVGAFGLGALGYLAAPGLAFAGALGLAIHAVPHRHDGARREHDALPPAQRRDRWRTVWLLYAANVVRFTVNMALVHLIVLWSEREALRRAGATVFTRELEARASMLNGPMQASMQVGMGAAGIAAGLLLRGRGERRAMILAPLLGASSMALLPHLGAWAWTMGIVAGVGFGGLVPVTISMAQRLLPHRTSLASGLMMGGAWALAFTGPPLGQALVNAWGLDAAFAVVGSFLLASSVLAWRLPR